MRLLINSYICDMTTDIHSDRQGVAAAWRRLAVMAVVAVTWFVAAAEPAGHSGDGTLVITAEVTEIADDAYAGRGDLKTVVFERGSRCRKIGARSFAGCDSLRSVELPEGLRSIGSHAFAYCSALESISLPDSLERLDQNSFARCRSLREAVIPDNVTVIESYVFADCTSLTTVRLPANRSLLGEQICAGCTGLQAVYAPSPEPPQFDCDSNLLGEGFGFSDPYAGVRLYVTPGLAEKYRMAPGWRLFGDISDTANKP